VKLVFEGLAEKLPVGERNNQLKVLHVSVPSDDWAVALVLVWAVTVSVCKAGATPPATAVNLKSVQLKSSGDAAVTFRVTLKTSDPWLEFI
jgi:hypothetical protein